MLQLAVIGAGTMGRLHARVLSELPNIKLVAVCDINRAEGEKLAKTFNTKFYQSYKELLKQEKLSGVIVAVPTSFHKEVALSCIKSGVNILVEKPLASLASDARFLVKEAKRKGIILTVGHIERFNPAVIKLKELIKKGEFGDIVSITVKRVGLYPPRIKDVNVITDLAVHDLDIVCDILGKIPERLFANGGYGMNHTQTDYADILLDFGKTSCYLQVNWMTPIKIRSLSLTGTKGYAELNYISQELSIYKSKFNTSFPEQFSKFRMLGKPKKKYIKVKLQEPLKVEIMNFIKAISNKNAPEVTGEQGIIAVALSEAIIKSLDSKKMINL